MNTDLKPCPFCDQNVKIDTRVENIPVKLQLPDTITTNIIYYITCMCGIKLEREGTQNDVLQTIVKLQSDWNYRANEQPR